MSQRHSFRILLAFSIFWASPSAMAQDENFQAPMDISKAKTSPEVLQKESLAKGLLAKKNFDKVIETLNPYSEQLTVSGQLMLAGAYNEKKDYENEVRILESVVARDNKNPQAFFVLAHAYLNSKKEDLAVESFRKAISRNPSFKPAYDDLLNLFIKKDNRYEARTLLSDMIDRFGKRPEFYNDLCRLLSLEGFLSQAESECQNAIRLSPNFPDNYVYLAQSLDDQKEEASTARVLAQAAKRFPASEFVQWAAGHFYAEKKNYPVAARYFKQATKADEKAARSQIGLAEALFESGDFEAAYQAYHKACELDQTHQPAFRSAAAKLRQKGKSDQSRKYQSGAYSCRR